MTAENELVLAQALKVALRYAYSKAMRNDATGKTAMGDLDPAYKRDMNVIYAGVVVARELGEIIE